MSLVTLTEILKQVNPASQVYRRIRLHLNRAKRHLVLVVGGSVGKYCGLQSHSCALLFRSKTNQLEVIRQIVCIIQAE